MKRICLIGSGGVGTMASFVLEKSGQVLVSTVLRSNYEAVLSKGYDIGSVDHGKISGWKPCQVLPSIGAAIPQTREEQYDYIVIAVKALPSTVSSIVHGIKMLVTPGTGIILLQNGLDVERSFADQFPDTPVASGVSLIGSRLTDQNAVYHEDPDILKIGAYFHHEESLPHAVQLKAARDFVALYAAGLRNVLNADAECIFVPDIIAAR